MKKSIQIGLVLFSVVAGFETNTAQAQFGGFGTGTQTGGVGGTGGFGTTGTGGFGATGAGGFGATGAGGVGATGAGGIGGANVSSGTPVSPFGGNGTPANIFGGFNKTPQGFSVPLGTPAGGAGGAAGLNSGRTTGIGGLGGLGGLGGGLGGRGGIGGLGGLGGRNNMLGGNNANNKKPIRAVVSIGFDRPETPTTGPDSTAVKAQARLEKVVLPGNSKNVRVTMEGRTATLNGQVASEREKRLMERLLSLEPGVDSIKNLLTTPTSPAEEVQASQNR